MKIGIYDPYLDSLSGGEKYMLTAASCLSKKHEVFVIWDNTSILIDAQKKFSIDLSSVKITRNIFSSNYPFFTRLKDTKAYDAIFYLSDGSIPIVRSKQLFLHFQFPMQWVNGRSLRNRIKMKRVKGIICNSSFTKKFIDRTFDIESKIVYPPASDEIVQPHVKKQNIIMTVGRFAEISFQNTFKKQEIMIDVFKKMIDAGLKEWRFVLVVSFKQNDRQSIIFLEKKIEEYPIEIIYNVSNEELNVLYAKAKIYWHAAGFGEDLSIHPELAEHFGIATVQAMDQSTVPIVFNAGGQTEIVDQGVNGFLWNSEEELIFETNKVIENEHLWKSLSVDAHKKAKIFSKQAFCNLLNSIIK